jgi:hypothetical protein
MKKLIAILLLSSLIVSVSAQGYTRERIPKSVKVLTTMAAWSILNGIGDGLNDNGDKGWGHAVNALSYATLIGGTVWSEPDKKEWLDYLVIGAGIRFITFDGAYNLTRDLPLTYIGTTATIDKAQAKVPAGFRTFTRGVVLCATVGFAIDKMDYKKIRHINKNKVYERADK